MKLIRLSGAATILLLLACLWTSAQAQQNLIDGHWEGRSVLPTGDIQLKLNLKVEAGALKAVMDIPESQLIDFPVPNVSYNPPKLRLEVPAGWGLAMFNDVGLRPEEKVIIFEGELRDGNIVGSLKVSTVTVPLTLKHGYPPVPYEREEVRFTNGDVTLAGAFIIPKAKGPYPVVVFTHGSSGNSRNEHLGEAELLAQNGVASLLYDKRGAGESTGASWEVATFEELASDAVAAVQYLHTRKDVNQKQIGMFGLSQGTWLIVMAAVKSKDVAFLISVSGSGIPVWEQDIFLATTEMRGLGFSEDDISAAAAFMKQKYEVGRTGLGWEQLDAKMKELRAAKIEWFPKYTGESRSLTNARFWWLAVFYYDPAADLAKLKIPVLALLGEKDLSFPANKVATRMGEYLKLAGNKDYTFKIFPTANHSIMVPQESNGKPFRRIITPEYRKTMISWILKYVDEAAIEAPVRVTR